MFVIDTHCDSIDRGMHGECAYAPYNMSAEHLQFMACYTDRPGLTPEESWQLLCAMRAELKAQTEKYPGLLALCRTVSEAKAAVAAGKKAMFFAMEGAQALDGKAERLDEVCADGLRCVSLTWNQNNLYGCANPFSGTAQDTGLTAAGIELVRECGRRGVLVDVSHASDATTMDILRTSTLPVLATHSDFREVAAHNRNLTREQALAIRDSGGVIGFNLCLPFLGGEHIESLLPHLEYALETVGEDAICFGCDIDGIDTYPAGLSLDSSLHEQMLEFLRGRGYGEELLYKLVCGNVLRVLETVCP
ncbi:MAG: membrane dipeptidase [Oscillospiraceae bacterium]|nr:membrane dipeptidase [Oscillospiraceae bacterium]